MALPNFKSFKSSESSDFNAGKIRQGCSGIGGPLRGCCRMLVASSQPTAQAEEQPAKRLASLRCAVKDSKDSVPAHVRACLQ